MQIVDTPVMQAADALAAERLGAPELMRRAGEAVAALVRLRFGAGRVVAFAGPGNNGGDAFAACAELAAQFDCMIYAKTGDRVSDARAAAQEHALASGVHVRPLPETEAETAAALAGATVALDALLGVGARQDTTVFRVIIDALNASAVPVIAIDLPTGVDATTGALATPSVISADMTLTLGAPKLGLFLGAGRSRTGELWSASIGMNDGDVAAARAGAGTIPHDVLDFAAFLHLLPRRADESDKRSAGAPLIIAGSAQFPGAAVLCARGAARAGAGYVTVATPQGAAASVRAHLIEQVVVTYDEDDVEGSIESLVDLTRSMRAAGIGPGLGLGENTAAIVRGFIERTSLPLVIDASAFAHVAKHLDLLRDRACVLTPHESEFARLSGKGTIEPGTRLERLGEFVARTGITTLLKGNTTLISDGRTMHLNPTGTSALATAGTGDVLTGIIATLLAQGLSPVDAARAGAYWHGLAGQCGARRRPVGVIAGDLPEALADALFQDDDHEAVGGLIRLR